MKKIEIITTEDGSSSIKIPDLNETYHSIYGAVDEANIVYIQNGFDFFEQATLNILEVGFGTGLNAILSYKQAVKNNVKLRYTAIEKYILDQSIISKLNYSQAINSIKLKNVFDIMHNVDINKEIIIDENFAFKLLNIDLREYKVEEKFDLIYFDAFAPNIQAYLWSDEIMKLMANSLKDNGVLVTYSTKGDVKRSLKKNGFKIEKLPGPKGKREVLRAVKININEL